MEGGLVSLGFIVEAHLLKNQGTKINITQARISIKHKFLKIEFGTQILPMGCYIWGRVYQHK
jgi:hypothetical protein